MRCVPKAWAVRMVEMTSSARVPPSAMYCRESCIYLEMNWFMTPPAMVMQGSMEDMARAGHQEWT